MLQRLSQEFRLIYATRHNPATSSRRVYEMRRNINLAISSLSELQANHMRNYRHFRQEPDFFFRHEPLSDLVHVADSSVPEHFRANGEILSAIDAQQRLINFQFEQDSINDLDPEWHDSLKTLDTLQTEFWTQIDQIFDKYQSPTRFIHPFWAIRMFRCPMLFDAHVVPQQTSSYLGKRDSFRQTPLHAAVTFTITNHLEKFINPSDINVQDVFGRTPLHIACSLPTLLHHRSDGFSRDGKGFSQSYAVRTLLTESTVDINLRDCDGRFAAEYAIVNHQHEIISMFRDLHKAFDSTSEVGTKVLRTLRAIEGTESIPRTLSERTY